MSLSSNLPCTLSLSPSPANALPSRATPGEGATRAGDDTPARPVVAIRCPAARDPVGIADGPLPAYAHSAHCQHAREQAGNKLIAVAVLSLPWCAYACRTHTREGRLKPETSTQSACTPRSHSRRVEGGHGAPRVPPGERVRVHRPDAHHESRYPRCRGEGTKKKGKVGGHAQRATL